MIGRWLGRWRELRAALVAAFGRFPIAVIALAAFAVMVNIEIAELRHFLDDTLLRAGFALVGAAAIAAACVLFGERHGWAPIPRHALSLVLAVAIGAALWNWERLGVAFPALLLASILTIPLAPYARSEASGFWEFVWRLLLAAALAFVAVIVFCLGLSAILASIDYLFGIDIKSSIYGHVWAIGLGFVGPLFALSLIPAAFPEDDLPEPRDIVVLGVRILADFVAVPLLVAYVVILHVYALKIAAEWELPKGQIGWMVLSFGLAVLTLRVVVHPMTGFSHLPTRLFRRWWAVGLVVPLVLLVIALWQRVSIYGVTPERYGLGLFALCLTLVLVAQLVPRFRGDIRLIPALGALALFLGSFGPWGMFDLSARSQIARLTQHLSDAGAIENGALVAAPAFSRDAALDVRSILDVLREMRQLDRLRPVLGDRAGDAFDTISERSQISRLWEAFNVEELPPLPSEVGAFSIDRGTGAVAIDGYDVVVPDLALAVGDALPNPVAVNDLAISIRSTKMTLVVEAGGATLTITPADLRGAIDRRLETVEKLPEKERTPFLAEVSHDGRQAALLFRSVAGKLTDTETNLTLGAFDLYLRRADWAADSGASGSEPARRTEP